VSPLATVSQLRLLLKLPNLSLADPYATMMVNQASTAVREAGLSTWTIDDPVPTGMVIAPQGARDVALWVAYRAYTNPKNLSRRGVGPISEAFQDTGIFGVELTPTEQARIEKLAGAGRSGGLWIQPLDTGRTGTMLTVPSDMVIAGDPFYIADVGQFPYAGYEYDETLGAPPVEYDGVTGV
jgi:hypothetical protein